MDIDAGDGAAVVARAHPGRRQGAARRRRFLDAGREALRGELAVLGIEQRAEDHDLVRELALEELLVVFLDAGTQVGQRIGPHVSRAAVEIERQRALRTRYAIPRQRHAAVPGDVGLDAERARRELQRHRRDWLVLAADRQRHAANHVIGIGKDVERPDVLRAAHGDALTVRGANGAVVPQGFAQHDLAGRSTRRERPQKRTIEAAQFRADLIVAERQFGLLDRVGQHEVETRDLRPAIEHRRQHAADLGGPDQGRRSLEWRRLIGLFVDRNHGDGCGRGVAMRPKQLPAQRGQRVDRPAMREVERRHHGQQSASRGDHEDCDGVPPETHPPPVLSFRYCSVTRRPITGPAPGAALGSITNAANFDFSVIEYAPPCASTILLLARS